MPESEATEATEPIKDILARTQEMETELLDAIARSNGSHYPFILRNHWLRSFSSLCVLPSREKENAFSYSRASGEADCDARRVRTSLARIARRQWGIGPDIIPDHALRDICERITRRVEPRDPHTEFRLISGDELRESYENCACHSCMSGEPDNVELYWRNPQAVKMIVHFNSHDRCDGRAIVWDHPELGLLLDREYPYYDIEADKGGSDYTCAEMRSAIRSYGISIGCRTRDDWVRDNPDMELTVYPGQKMPYLDTLFHGRVRKAEEAGKYIISLSRYSSSDGVSEPFHSQGGGCLTRCESCGRWHYSEDADSEWDASTVCVCSTSLCHRCGTRHHVDSMRSAEILGVEEEVELCDNCYHRLRTCVVCGGQADRTYMHQNPDGEHLCGDCSASCDHCGNDLARTELDEYSHCITCAHVCSTCGRHVASTRFLDEDNTCHICQSARIAASVGAEVSRLEMSEVGAE